MDAVAHNLVILPAHDSTEKLFRGEAIDGPSSVTYSVGARQRGAYHFHCELHPTEMMGKFVVGGTGAIVRLEGWP